jgi:hypothetical protein
MTDQRMIQAQALLLAKQFIERELRELPPHPIERPTYCLPYFIPVGQSDGRTIFNRTKKEMRTDSARSSYYRLLYTVEKQLDNLSEPV